MKILKKVFVMTLCVCLLFSSNIATAHSGRTDSRGGHHDYKNRSGLGDYHYHHGMEPHLHPHGVCPYSSTSSSNSKTTTKQKSSSYNASTIKKVQNRLNKLGYHCGSPDGHCGRQTQKAIRKYQRKKGLAVNGKINKKLLRKLKIKS